MAPLISAKSVNKQKTSVYVAPTQSKTPAVVKATPDNLEEIEDESPETLG
jgi:hypothetical protein